MHLPFTLMLLEKLLLAVTTLLWCGIAAFLSHMYMEEGNMCFEFTGPLEWRPVGAEKQGTQKVEERCQG